jgi:hypothetical protein
MKRTEHNDLQTKQFTYFCEGSRMLVNHLHNSNDAATDEDGHAQYGLGTISCQLVYSTVEPWITVCINNVQHLTSISHLACNTFAKWESVTYVHLQTEVQFAYRVSKSKTHINSKFIIV